MGSQEFLCFVPLIVRTVASQGHWLQGCWISRISAAHTDAQDCCWSYKTGHRGLQSHHGRLSCLELCISVHSALCMIHFAAKHSTAIPSAARHAEQHHICTSCPFAVTLAHHTSQSCLNGCRLQTNRICRANNSLIDLRSCTKLDPVSLCLAIVASCVLLQQCCFKRSHMLFDCLMCHSGSPHLDVRSSQEAVTSRGALQ